MASDAANDEDPVVSSRNDYPGKRNAGVGRLVPAWERALPQGWEPATIMDRQYR